MTEEDVVVIEDEEVNNFLHFLKACKAMSPKERTDLLIGQRGMSVRCGDENKWGFMGNLPRENALIFQVSKLSEFNGLNFDDIVKLKTKDLHQMLINPTDACLKIRFRDSWQNDIFVAELCPQGEE